MSAVQVTQDDVRNVIVEEILLNSPGHAVADPAPGRDSTATDDGAHHGSAPPRFPLHPDATGHAAVNSLNDAAHHHDDRFHVRMHHTHVHRFPAGLPLWVVVGNAAGDYDVTTNRFRRPDSGEGRRTESGDSGWGEGQSRWDEGGQQPVPPRPGHAPVDATLAYPALKKIRTLSIDAELTLMTLFGQRQSSTMPPLKCAYQPMATCYDGYQRSAGGC